MHPNSIAAIAPTQWVPGKSPNPGGKPVAARNKLSNYFLNAMIRDFEEHGEQAIAETREKDPGAYLRVIASILPKEMTVHDGQSAVQQLLAGISDSELASLFEGIRLLAAATVNSSGNDEAKITDITT